MAENVAIENNGVIFNTIVIFSWQNYNNKRGIVHKFQKKSLWLRTDCGYTCASWCRNLFGSIKRGKWRLCWKKKIPSNSHSHRAICQCWLNIVPSRILGKSIQWKSDIIWKRNCIGIMLSSHFKIGRNGRRSVALTPATSLIAQN